MMADTFAGWWLALHLGARYVCFDEYVAQVVAVHRNQHWVIWVRGLSRERYCVRAISVISNAWRRDLNPFFGRERAVLFVVNCEVLRQGRVAFVKNSGS